MTDLAANKTTNRANVRPGRKTSRTVAATPPVVGRSQTERHNRNPLVRPRLLHDRRTGNRNSPGKHARTNRGRVRSRLSLINRRRRGRLNRFSVTSRGFGNNRHRRQHANRISPGSGSRRRCNVRSNSGSNHYRPGNRCADNSTPSVPESRLRWQQKKGWQQQGAWQGRNSWQQNRAQSWAQEHRTWTQRGGYGGYYIPQARFGLYFGSSHAFRLTTRPVMYMGYPRFEYGGFSFLMVDPWPEYWADDWYGSDDVYIDYDDGYYLYNRRQPDVRLAITITL